MSRDTYENVVVPGAAARPDLAERLTFTALAWSQTLENGTTRVSVRPLDRHGKSTGKLVAIYDNALAKTRGTAVAESQAILKIERTLAKIHGGGV